jgi:hypothetical protein
MAAFRRRVRAAGAIVAGAFAGAREKRGGQESEKKPRNMLDARLTVL